jgi:hypothetical protein
VQFFLQQLTGQRASIFAIYYQMQGSISEIVRRDNLLEDRI